MKRAAVYILWLFILLYSPAGAEWFRGNTHTHTNLSDGDSPPETVVRWYKEHGYNFVVITDHNKDAKVDELKTALASDGSRFIIIPGNEISCSSEKRPVHMNALNVSNPVKPYNEATVISTLQRNIDEIYAAGAVPVVCHPNFVWAFGSKELLMVENLRFIEVWNAHPIVNNLGGVGAESTEQIWDALLSNGKQVYGVASDDTHTLKEFTPRHANPGRGWIMVRSDCLTPEDIISALEQGDFYFSTGVELSDIGFDGKTCTVTVKPAGQTRYTVEFIGNGGTVLALDTNLTAVYKLKGTEGYVRARVTDSNGFKAWTQPVFLKK